MTAADEELPLLPGSDGILTTLKIPDILDAARTIPAIPAILLVNSIVAASSTPLFTLGFQRVYLDIICCRQLQDPDRCHDERVCRGVDGVPAQLSQIIGNMASSQAICALMGLGLWFYIWKSISKYLNLDRRWPLFASLGGELVTEAMKVFTLHLIFTRGLSLDLVLNVPWLNLVTGGGAAMYVALRNAVVTEGKGARHVALRNAVTAEGEGARERAYRERTVTFILLNILPLIAQTVTNFIIGSLQGRFDPWKSLYAGLGIYSLAPLILLRLPKARAQPSGENDGQGGNDHNQDNGNDNGNNWRNNIQKYSVLLFALSVNGVLGYSITVFSPQYVLSRYSTRISDAALILGAGDVVAAIVLTLIVWRPQQQWRGFRVDLLLLTVCFASATLASIVMGLSQSKILFSIFMAAAFGSTTSTALIYSYFAATSTGQRHAEFFAADQIIQAVSRFLAAKGLDWLLRQGIVWEFFGLPFFALAVVCFSSFATLVWLLFEDRSRGDN